MAATGSAKECGIMGKQVVGFAITDTSYTIANVTFGHCNRIDTGAAIDTADATLTHQSNGQYVLNVPNVTHTTGPAAFFLYVTADTSKYVEGAINPILGDELAASKIVEGTLTWKQVMRLILAACTGKSTSGGTRYRDVADTKDRISAECDGLGNRTSVTLDAD